MSISVYVETKESVPGHLVKFSKAKTSQGIDQLLDELACVGQVTFWIRKQQVHIETVGKRYKACLIKSDNCDVRILTKNQMIRLVNEMMGAK